MCQMNIKEMLGTITRTLKFDSYNWLKITKSSLGNFNKHLDGKIIKTSNFNLGIYSNRKIITN